MKPSHITDYVYLDNNATNIMPIIAVNTMIEYVNKGNASSSYATGVSAGAMIRNFCDYILSVCKTNASKYTVIINSGASESNSHIFKSILTNKQRSHIIVSSIEHNSIIYLCEDSAELADFTYIKPSASGHIFTRDVMDAVNTNTTFVSVMTANNETGAINDVAEMAKECHSAGIIFHTDASQSFGKYPTILSTGDIGAVTVSFHKCNGAQGVGALIVRNDIVQILTPLIYGSQNNRLRGGTENISGIAGSFAGLRYCLSDVLTKNIGMSGLKNKVIKCISNKYPSVHISKYKRYIADNPNVSILIVFLSGNDERYLPNTILMSIVKFTKPYVCNIKMKKIFEQYGIVLSIGSACNTKSASASHVLNEMGCDNYVKSGTIRVSFGNTNTVSDAERFCEVFYEIMKRVESQEIF